VGGRPTSWHLRARATPPARNPSRTAGAASHDRLCTLEAAATLHCPGEGGKLRGLPQICSLSQPLQLALSRAATAVRRNHTLDPRETSNPFQGCFYFAAFAAAK
jgi:hypothetical protein